MRYFYRDGCYTPKHCIYGPRPNKGLVLNPWEWWRLHDHLGRDQRELAVCEENHAREEAKKHKSWEMTSTWENTLASIKLTGEKKRIEKIEMKAQKKLDEYNEIMKKRKEDHKAMMDEARRRIYQEKDTTKTLTGAMRFAAILHERNKQIEFNAMLRGKSDKLDAQYAAKVKREAEEFYQEKRQEKINDKNKKLQFRKTINEQIQEQKARASKTVQAELEKEIIDLKLMKVEMEKIEAQEREEKQKNKIRLKQELINGNQGEIKVQEARQLEEDEEEEIRKIYRDVACEIQKKRKIVEWESIQGVLKCREKQSEKIADLLKGTAKLEAEEASFSRAAQAKEEEELRVAAEKKAKKKQLIEELKEMEEEAKREEERKILKKKEKMKWELIQKLRRDEINQVWMKSKEERVCEEKKAVNEILQNQMAENKEKLEEERKEEIEFGKVSYEKADQELLEYCDYTLNFVKDRGFPDIPVKKAIEKVKKQNFLCPIKKEIKFLQSNVPIESVQVYAKRPKGGPLNSLCHTFKN